MKRAMHSSPPRTRRRSPRLCAWFLLTFATLACQEPGSAPSEGSNSNWLVACATDAECGQSGACRCGGCTRECSNDDDCQGLTGARCARAEESARSSQCRSEPVSAGFGICLPSCEPGSCREGQACVGGACVLSTLPDSEFCQAVVSAEPTQRTREDELLQALNDVRAAGGVTCGSSPPSAPAPALRLDARLVCAARVLASDMNGTRVQSLTDSLGRSSEQRFSAAGYVDDTWAESFAFQESSASAALNVMLSDASSCPWLVDPGYRDVGVAYVGDVNVLSLASE